MSRSHHQAGRAPSLSAAFVLGVLILLAAGAYGQGAGQVETTAGPPPQYAWEHRLHVEGHLALTYSPDAAFSPDSSTLAVIDKSRVVLANLADGGVKKVLKLHLNGLADLDIQSANFVSPSRLFILANGLLRAKHGGAPASPEIGFQWDINQDALFGKVEAIGGSGGFLPVRYFPRIGYLALYKDSTFTVWDPVTGRGGNIKIPQLNHAPRLFEFSPDGHWLLLAQIEMNASPDPIVVLLREHKFADVLAGHHGPVLGMMFSRDGKMVVTACADGNVRIYSVPQWKLLVTLSGHRGPVHWAEFSPDGTTVASAGEDQTVRVWSVATGKLLQDLQESRQPLLTVAFSPNGQYLAASAANEVHVWVRTPEN